MDNHRYAILDCDFISKLIITQNDQHQKFINYILSIDKLIFISHQYTIFELSKHSKDMANYITNTNKVTFYSDKDLLTLLKKYFKESSYLLYINILHKSCDVFSATLFQEYYLPLIDYVNTKSLQIDFYTFINILNHCDSLIPNDNNIGEIKLYTMSLLLQMITGNIYIFCSDDRKARYILSANSEVECISCLSSFYLTKKYLKLTKQEAQSFFDSWMAIHHQTGQYQFQIYSKSGYQLVKLPGQIIFELLYDDKLELMKDGFFHIK